MPVTTLRRLTILNRFYWPAIAATGQMLTELAEDLAADGWEVTVITGRNCEPGSRGDGRAREETRNGVRILRVGTTAFGARGLPGRFLEYATYVWSSFLRLIFLRNPGVVVSMSDPPLLLLPVFIGRLFRGYRIAYWVQDVYPQLFAALGFINERSLGYRSVRALFAALHRSCDAVIALGPRMAEAMIAAGARADRTDFVHNWIDAEKITPVEPADNNFRKINGLAHKFVVLYSGNAGRAHEFDTLLGAVTALKDDAGIEFVFIGGGKSIAFLKENVKSRGLSNVRFIGYQPLENLSNSLSAGDVSIVTERADVAGLLLPSKTYAMLAIGRPVLFIGSERSDAASIVRSSGAGETIAPNDAAALTRLIRRLRDNPLEAAAMGKRGRALAEQVYSRRLSTKRWAAVMNSLLERSEAPSLPQPAFPP